LAYDIAEPTAAQLITLVKNDSVAVIFGGISGFKLDSVRVALRQTGTLKGGIWQYTGSITPSPNGKKLLIPINAVGKMRPVYDIEAGSYPIPYPNWVKIDTRNPIVDVSNDFVVAFAMNGTYVSDGSGDNRVMATEIAGVSPYPSITYTQNPTSGSPRWVYVVNNEGGTVFPYLIRAYVSSKTSDINEEYELIPGTYSLDQNYPNPFNPETVISYQLTKPEHVSLKIYDSLGRLVRVLIDSEKGAGRYKTNWNGTDETGNFVTSGIYFYTISAGEFSQTKKMILMK
jgi:hypothetical protein